MVTNPKYPGLEVAITVDNQPLREYDDDNHEDPTSNTITKYVEAKTGASFAVTVNFKPSFSAAHGVLIRISVDGEPLFRWHLARKSLSSRSLKGDCIRWQENGKWVEQKLCFSELNIVEEAQGSAPDSTALRDALSKKGLITISLQFIKKIRVVRSRRGSGRSTEYIALENVPEKALKGEALSHQAVFSKPEKSKNQRANKTKSAEPVHKEPFAIFHFKYRSLASLKALRIVAVDDITPVPLEERPVEQLNPEELKELVRRLRQREAETSLPKQESNLIKQETRAAPQIKRDKSTNDDDEVSMIESRPCKRSRVDPEIIVID